MTRQKYATHFRRNRLHLTPTDIKQKSKRIRIITLGIYLSSLSVLLTFVPSAHAAGGAHVIDDANVEAVGTCHVETWGTRNNSDAGLFNLSGACVSEKFPTLEIGAGVQHTWGKDDEDNKVRNTLIGPAFKWNLRSTDTGIGVALAGSTNWSTTSDRWEDASLMIPVSVSLNEHINLNVNYGWSYERDSEHRHAQMYGAQIEADVGHNVALMAEVFQRQHSLTGSQFGVRWTPHNGPIDIDLLYGRKLDGQSPRALTVGLTLRY